MTSFGQLMEDYTGMGDKEVGTIARLGALTKSYEDTADYQGYRSTKVRLLQACTSNKAAQLSPLQSVGNEQLDSLRQRLWAKYADLALVSTTTDLTVPAINYTYSAEVLESGKAATTKDWGLRATTPTFLKAGMLKLKYTPEVTTSMLTNYEQVLDHVHVRMVAVIEPTTWGLLDPALKLFVQRGTTVFMSTSRVITTGLIGGFGDYLELDTIGKLARWNLIEAMLTTRGYWSEKTSAGVLSIAPLQLDKDLTTVKDYYIPISLHHAYQRLHTFYKTVFYSVTKREAAVNNDLKTLGELDSLPAALANVYYKNEHYLQLLTCDDDEEEITIDALRKAELQVYYDDATSGDGTAADN
ncbi:hypothetical protein FOZ63_028679 [Perkinsus olseni]|uniref:Uncharacterized protein n=1 Tax=Perkinsus olseni TaxID=32597 RepID=A0A7J6U9Y3_PEROL|nr:hypothetical protein FOZ63_028679 [Perkinsus olseni]KAF4753766.1 hypothetical protein FOZ62_028260 [Perkinsus olseni]